MVEGNSGFWGKLLSGFWNVLKFGFSKKAFRWTFTGLFIILASINAYMVFQETGDSSVFMNDVLKPIVDTQGEIIELVDIAKTQSGWDFVWTSFAIFEAFWFLYIWFWLLGKIVMLFRKEDNKNFKWFLSTIFLLYLLTLAFNLWFIHSSGGVIHVVDIIPFKGVIYFVQNIGLWITPLRTLVN